MLVRGHLHNDPSTTSTRAAGERSLARAGQWGQSRRLGDPVAGFVSS